MVLGGGSLVVDFLFIDTPIVGVCNCYMFCCTLLYVHSSIAIMLMGKRELIALLNLSSWCLVIVKWLFFAVPWVCLPFGDCGISSSYSLIIFDVVVSKIGEKRYHMEIAKLPYAEMKYIKWRYEIYHYGDM